jgi:TP901 family phage tail tape measure protein
MGIELAKAYIRVRADSSRLGGDLNAVTKKTGTAFSTIGSQLRGMMAGIGVLSVGAGIALAGREAANFEDTMVMVRANARLLGEEGEDAFKKMEKAAREMGASTRFTANQAAEAMNQLVLGGLDANQAIGALPSVLNLAASAGMGMAESAKVIVDNMIKYQMTARDTGKIADFLSSAQSRAQITAAELAAAHQTLGSVAAEMGVSFRDVTAILTGMGKAGADMNSAGTALAMALARLSDRGGPASGVLKELGVNIDEFTDAGGALDLVALLRAISDAMPTNKMERGAKAIELFGIKGKVMLGIFGLMGRGSFVEDMVKTLDEDIGRAAMVASARMDTFIGMVLKMKSAMTDLAITALTPVLKMLKPITEIIGKLSNIMSFATQQFFNLDNALGGMLSKTIVATTAVLALVKAIALLGPVARAASVAIRLATLSTGWFALVAVIGTAIAGLITFVQWLWKTDAVQKALSETATAFGLAWDRVKRAFDLAVKIIVEGINMIGKWLGGLVGVDIPELANSIEEMAANALRFISDFVLNATEWVVAILTNWKAIWGALPGIARAALSYVLDVSFNVAKILPQLYGFALRKAFDFFIWFAGKVISLIGTLMMAVVKILSKIPQMIIDVLSGGDISGTIMGEVGKALKGFGKGLKGEFPDMSGIFVPSDRTKKLMTGEVGAVLDKIAGTKRELELGRVGDLGGEEGLSKAEEIGQTIGEAAAKPLIEVGERLSFRELGTKIQDSLLDRGGGKDAKDDKRNNLLALGVKKQDELIKVVKEQNKAGTLTGADR